MPSINLRPLSQTNPLPIDETVYKSLILRKENGWSHCDSEEEWFAKLHYLRMGYTEEKIDQQSFLARELALVDGWLRVVRSGKVKP